jgi:hypothetical protein
MAAASTDTGAALVRENLQLVGTELPFAPARHQKVSATTLGRLNRELG